MLVHQNLRTHVEIKKVKLVVCNIGTHRHEVAMAVLFFVLCFEHNRQALKILAYSCRQDFPDLENKEIKPLDVDLILDIWINFLYKNMFVLPCPHWWQALRVCWPGKPQKHTHSMSYCYSQQSASLIYKYSQHYCPVVPFFFFFTKYNYVYM